MATATLLRTSPTISTMQYGHGHGHAREGLLLQKQQKMTPNAATTDGSEGPASSTKAVKRVDGTFAHSSYRETVPDVESEDDEDKGEETSASGAARAASAAMVARLGGNISSKHLDIASLLKEPLRFIPARYPEDPSQNIPYEPLPMGPSPFTSILSVKQPATPDNHLSQNGNGQLASSSPQMPSSSAKGKGPTNMPSSSSSAASTSATSVHPSLVPLPINWPQSFPAGPGYNNLGNTCFLNATLQALTHTAPLVACLMGEQHHSQNNCSVPQGKFCMLCAMQKHIRFCFKGSKGYSRFSPSLIVGKLSSIAKHMRIGRQEDAHEFLRFSLDNMLESAAINLHPPAKTAEHKEQTFLYRIFGGKLQSRVSCASCKQDSDTFDSIMDISVDVSHATSVKEALQAFVRTDVLQGANKYKCEKCKSLVNARKQFSISVAPQILHIHLKRFTPTGKKISGPIDYRETISLQDYMSDDAVDRIPTYRLYAVVSHSGGGPHSGHYYAHVRAGNNRWYSMNDDSVTDIPPNAALTQRNAYLLFYERCNRLGEAVGRIKIPPSSVQMKGAVKANEHIQGTASVPKILGKRKDRDGSDALSSPFPQPSSKLHQPNISVFKQYGHSSSPNRQHQHHSSPHHKQHQQYSSSPYVGGQPTIKSTNFFSIKNKPKLVGNMIPRPR